MLNEGIIVNDTAALVRSEIVNQIGRLGPCTPDELERAVFGSLAGRAREEVDWDIEDNQAGHYSWLKSFDQLISQLVEDGYILIDEQQRLVPTEAEPHVDYSHLASPSATSG